MCGVQAHISKGLDSSVEFGVTSCLGRLSRFQYSREPAEPLLPLAVCVRVCVCDVCCWRMVHSINGLA